MSDAKPPSGSQKTGEPTGTTVADLGSRSKKSIKRLSRGGGRLLKDLEALLAQLKADAVVANGKVRAVVVVVKEKRRGVCL